MALEEFDDSVEEQGSSESVKGNSARPRVSKQTHEKVRDFTSNSGLGISEGYNLIIGKCLSNQDILEEVLTRGKDYNCDLNTFEQDLLEDIAVKCNELGSFPDRQDINEDSDMNGFPVYVMYLGDTEHIRSMLNNRYPDVL